MAYGHIWTLLPKCAFHPDKQACVVLDNGVRVCGACAMHDEKPLTKETA